MKIITRYVEGYRCFFFRYAAGSDMVFEFSLLSECREPEQSLFRNELLSRGINPTTIEVNGKPYLITVDRKETLK